MHSDHLKGKIVEMNVQVEKLENSMAKLSTPTAMIADFHNADKGNITHTCQAI